jgi:hypothetical protein
MTIIGQKKRPLTSDGETVPEDHPIAASFPEEFPITLKMRRTGLEVVETFERVRRLDPLSRERVAGPIERRRTLRATYETWTGELSDATEEVTGLAEIKGVSFGPDGTPSDPEKWKAIVAAVVESVKANAFKRVRELLSAGIESEIAGE